MCIDQCYQGMNPWEAALPLSMSWSIFSRYWRSSLELAFRWFLLMLLCTEKRDRTMLNTMVRPTASQNVQSIWASLRGQGRSSPAHAAHAYFVKTLVIFHAGRLFCDFRHVKAFLENREHENLVAHANKLSLKGSCHCFADEVRPILGLFVYGFDHGCREFNRHGD